MISILKYTVTASREKALVAGMAAVYMLVALVALPGYFPWTSVSFILGMIGLPLTILYSPARRSSFRFYPVVLVFGVLSLLVPEKTVLFVSLVMAILCIAEQVWQKLPLLSLLTIAGMSTTVQYLAGVFSFPLRLSLTRFAASLLNLTGTRTVAEGNMIIFGAREYSVDPACMGIKMLLTSLLCGVFIIAILQKKQERYLRWHGVALALVAVFVLNLLANIVRVLLLVYFDIRPANIMHELMGIICLAVYVLLPAVWIVRQLISKYGYGFKPDSKPVKSINTKWLLLLQGLLAGVLFISVAKSQSGKPAAQALVHVSGYSAVRFDADVVQYRNATALVYVKKINGILSGEHNPAMCWLGTGYTFEQVTETPMNGTTIYTGVLRKGNEQLYTAWWYDNGSRRTASQIAWRWDVVKGGKQYSIINVTAASRELLTERVREITGARVFRAVL